MTPPSYESVAKWQGCHVTFFFQTGLQMSHVISKVPMAQGKGYMIAG